MSTLNNIEKLGDDNYETWSILMRSLLINNQLWSVICEPTKDLPDDWKSKDEKAAAQITLCVQHKHLRIIKSCETAFAA